MLNGPASTLRANAQTEVARECTMMGFMHSFGTHMSQLPFFHQPSGTVRFWVLVDDLHIGASIGKATLHYRYAPQKVDEDPLVTYTHNAAEIDAAVRRRVATGSREPVMLRDWDVRKEPTA